MTQPPEISYAPRTEAEGHAQAIRDACATIRRGWDQMLPDGPPANRTGGSPSARITADDHATTDADIDPLTRLVSLRYHAMTSLKGWSRIVIMDRPIKNDEARPLGDDVAGMCDFLTRHADWISGQDCAEACAEELAGWARKVKAVVNPTRREWMNLGECPLDVDSEDGPVTCAGQVRAWLRAEDRDGEVMAKCQRCGVEAVATWWESAMFDDAETKVWMTDRDLVTFVHAAFGKVITEATVRQWVRRGVVEPSGIDDKGRRVFHREAVVWALDRRDKREEIGA